MKRRNKKSAFDRCVESVAARGAVADPRAVCASAGVRKYGQAEMTRRAVVGKRRAARRRGNPGKFTFKTERPGPRGAFAYIFRDGVNVETIGPIQSFKGLPGGSAKEDKAAAAAAARDRITDLKQLEGTSWQAGGRGYGRGNPADEKWSGSRVVRMWSNDGRKWEGRLYVNQGETATTQYKRGVTKGTLERWADKVLAGRYNPAESARAVSEEFHGRPVKEMVSVSQRRHYHKYLAELGELRQLVVVTHDGRYRVKMKTFEGALLCANEDKNQLYILGGNQSVKLRDFGIGHEHEIEDLGELHQIDYFTTKEHLGSEGGRAVYWHKFRAPRPSLHFRVRDSTLEISGGRYRITAEGIES